MICSSCLNNFANELLLSECTGVHRLQNFAQGKKESLPEQWWANNRRHDMSEHSF